MTPNAAVGISDHRVRDLAPPAFLQRDDELVRLERAAGDTRLPSRQRGELLENELQRALYLDPAYEHPGVDIARPRSRDGDVGEPEDAVRMVVPHVAREVAGPRHRPHESQLQALRAPDDADAVESALDRGSFEHQHRHRLQLITKPREQVSHCRGHRRRQVEADTAGPNEPTAIAVAGQRHEHVETLATHATEERRRRLIGDIAGDGAQIADVVGEPFKFEGDAANGLRPRGLPTSRQRLDRTTVRACMSDHRIACDRLRDQHSPLAGHSLQQALHAAMLVAEHDLEKQHLLAVRLEAEVRRLDNAGVDRTDRDLVHLLAVDAKERVGFGVEDEGRAPGRTVIRQMATQGFEPRVPVGHHGTLLRNLALEGVCLGTVWSEGRILLAYQRTRGTQLPEGVMGQDGDQPRGIVALRHAEERDETPLPGHGVEYRLAKPVHCLDRHGAKRDRPTVAQLLRLEASHGALPPSAAAACARTVWRGPGR